MNKKNPFRSTLLFCFFLFAFSLRPAVAQKKDVGTWTTFNLKVKADEKWSAFSELQLRSLSFCDRFYYYELKGGATYSFQKNYSFSIGTGLYHTFNGGEKFEDYSEQKEIRVWQQFIMNQKLSVVKLEHRYRAEQRFLKQYANRFRYRLNVSVPINNRDIIAGTFYVSVYDEVFFTDKLPHFRRNRFHLGAGYRFNDRITLQIGWLNQADYTTTTSSRKNYLFSSVSFDLKGYSSDAPGHTVD